MIVSQSVERSSARALAANLHILPLALDERLVRIFEKDPKAVVQAMR
jgi:hypothetical protein